MILYTITLVLVIAAIIFYTLWTLRKPTMENQKKDLVYLLDKITFQILKKCLICFGIVISVDMVFAIIGFILRYFIPDAVRMISKGLDLLATALLIGVILAVFIVLVTKIVVDSIMLPFHNYVKAVGKVYKKYSAGRVYYYFCQFIEKTMLIGILAICVIIVHPISNGWLFLNCDSAKGCLDELYDNGNIQGGNRAYMSEGFFGVKSWKIKYDENTGWFRLKSDGNYKQIGIANKNMPNCAYVDKKLIGVKADNEVYIRSNFGYSFFQKKYNWKKAIQTDGKYDYDKIAAIVRRQAEQCIPWEEIASVIGAMEERILIGVNDEGECTFQEQTEEGTYFIWMKKNETLKYGPYYIDTSKPVMAIGNLVLCIDKNGGFYQVDMSRSSEKAVIDRFEINGDLITDILTFNYFITDEKLIQVCLVTKDKAYAFSFGTDNPDLQIYSGLENDNNAIQGVYVSSEGIVIDRENNVFNYSTFEDTTFWDWLSERINNIG